MSRDRKKALISSEYLRLSMVRQCELVDISRSSYYHIPNGESELNLELVRKIDRQFLKTPFYRLRQMVWHLRRDGLRNLLIDRPNKVWCADISVPQ